ncbi:MAG: CHASE2 domain-containing protein, partial [Rhodoferax sp.]
KGKIVLIGSTAPSLFDIKASPLARIHPGVEILATAIDNFKHGDALRERPRWVMGLAALLLIWGMAVALYRQTRIESFDRLFGVLQVALVAFAFAVLNLSHWYIDTSAPLALGLLYFAVARAYYGVSGKVLATGQVRDLARVGQGQRLLAILAIRLEQAGATERRRLKGQVDQLVAQSSQGAARVAQLVEDPGFVQAVFADWMLVYWLQEDATDRWTSDAERIEQTIGAAHAAALARGRLRFARTARMVHWSQAGGWTAPAFATILGALEATLGPATQPDKTQ